MSDFGKRPELTWLPVERLDVDPAYQRSLDTPGGKRLVQKIVDNFRWASFQATLATPGEAERWLIIDGQHRVRAARLIGLGLVPAVVIHDASPAEQAAAFVGANRDRVPVSAQALFHARLIAGDPEALTLRRLCDAAGIELLRYNQAMRQVPAGKTPAVSRLLVLLRTHGEAITGEAIKIVGECYGKQPGALRSIVFESAARFLADKGTPVELAAGLRRLGPSGIEKIAFGITTNSAIPLVMRALWDTKVAEPTRMPVAADVAPPFRGSKPVSVLNRASRPEPKRPNRAAEADEIAEFIATKGVTRGAPAFAAPSLAAVDEPEAREKIRRIVPPDPKQSRWR